MDTKKFLHQTNRKQKWDRRIKVSLSRMVMRTRSSIHITFYYNTVYTSLKRSSPLKKWEWRRKCNIFSILYLLVSPKRENAWKCLYNKYKVTILIKLSPNTSLTISLAVINEPFSIPLDTLIIVWLSDVSCTVCLCVSNF